MLTYYARPHPRVSLAKERSSDTPTHQQFIHSRNNGALETFLADPNLSLDALIDSGYRFETSSLAIVSALFFLCRKFNRLGKDIQVLWINGSGGNGWHLLDHLAFYLEGLSNMYAFKGRMMSPASLWFEEKYLQQWRPHGHIRNVGRRFVAKEVPVWYFLENKTIAFNPSSTIVLLDPYEDNHNMPGLKYFLDKAIHVYRVTKHFSIQRVVSTSLALNPQEFSGSRYHSETHTTTAAAAAAIEEEAPSLTMRPRWPLSLIKTLWKILVILLFLLPIFLLLSKR